MRRKLFVIGDHPVTRRGYAALLKREDAVELCGAAATLDEADAEIPKHAPDLVLIDLTVEDSDLLQWIKDFNTYRPDLPVLVISAQDAAVFGERAVAAGARGFLSRQHVDAHVVEALHRIAGGHLYPGAPAEATPQQTREPHEHGRRAVERLTRREKEVFELLGRGLSTREIAAALSVSPKTVESHRSRVKAKLGFESNTRLIRHAVQWTQRREP